MGPQIILCNVWLTSQAERTVLLQNIKASLRVSLKLYYNVWPLRRHFHIKVANKWRGVQNESLEANYLEYIICNTICASSTMSLGGSSQSSKLSVMRLEWNRSSSHTKEVSLEECAISYKARLHVLKLIWMSSLCSFGYWQHFFFVLHYNQVATAKTSLASNKVNWLDNTKQILFKSSFLLKAVERGPPCNNTTYIHGIFLHSTLQIVAPCSTSNSGDFGFGQFRKFWKGTSVDKSIALTKHQKMISGICQAVRKTLFHFFVRFLFFSHPLEIPVLTLNLSRCW